MDSVRRTRRLFVVEEHTEHGGFGQMLAHYLAAPASLSIPSLTNMRWVTSPAYTGRRSSIARNAGWIRPPLSLRSLCNESIIRRSAEVERGGSANIRQLQGPILVLGASGFIGANLLRRLLEHREDVYGTATQLPAWRLEGLPRNHVLVTDLLIDSNLDAMLDGVKPRTIFDCIAYGAYSFETDRELIYRTNFNLISRLLGRLDPRKLSCYVQPAAPRNMETIPPGRKRMNRPHPTATIPSPKWLLPA